MGFFSDLGNGIASIVKAPFEGVGALVQGVGQGIGSIIHGSQNCQQPPPAYCGQLAQQQQGCDPQGATQMLNFQNALMTNMLLQRQLFAPCLCAGF